MKSFFKRIIRILLVLTMLPMPSVYAAAEKYYNVEDALEYARENANNDDGTVCDQFVKAALMAGNVEILAGDVDPVRNAIIDGGYGHNIDLQLDADEVYININDNPELKPGDIMFFYCDTCKDNTHTAIVGGWDEEGNVYCYGHNPGWDEDDNEFGRYRHKGHDKETYCDSKWSVYTAISMDTSVKSHWHDFSEKNPKDGKYYYEKKHPHPMYAKCDDCDVRYYLGWNAENTTACTTCNPPLGDNPVITTCEYVEGSKNYIKLVWSTVYDVVSYNVHRAKSKNGTYFKLGNVESPNMNNGSFDMGTTYWYKIEAILENGKSRWSEPVSVVAGVTKEKLEAPVITVQDNEGKPQVKWSHVSGAVSYDIYRSTTAEFKVFDKYSTNNTSYTNMNAVNGNIYYYKIVAIAPDVSLNSDYSNIESFTMPKVESPVIRVVPNAEYDGYPQVKWEHVLGAVKYEVYRATEIDGEYTLMKTTDVKSYTNTGVSLGQRYYYKIRAIANVPELSSDFSNIYEFRMAMEKLKAPKITVKNNNSLPELEWSIVAGAEKYLIYRSDNEKFTDAQIRETTETVYIDDEAVNGNTYYYKVVAVAEEEEYNSDGSNEVKYSMPKLSAPVVTIEKNSDNAPLIKWKEVSGAVEYQIYRSKSIKDGYELVSKTKEMSYVDSSVNKSRIYYYKVKAVAKDEKLNSDLSDGCAFNPSAKKLSAPKVSVTSHKTGSYKNCPQIKWNRVSQAVKYVVYRAESENGEYVKVRETTGLSYTNTAVESGVTYYYKVVAISKNESYNSDFSNTIEFKVTGSRKVQTLTDMGRQILGQPRIRWSKVTGATSYEVWRRVEGGEFKLVTISHYLTHTNVCSRGFIYEYRVRPVFADGSKGEFSNIVKVACYLKEPTVTIGANEKYNGAPQLKWNSIYNADFYEIYRAESEDGEFKKVYTTKYRSYTNTAAESGKTYFYKVKAVNITGNIDSGFSNIECFEYK